MRSPYSFPFAAALGVAEPLGDVLGHALNDALGLAVALPLEPWPNAFARLKQVDLV